MNKNQETRLRLLESATASTRRYFLFDESACNPAFDIEAAKEKLRMERGATDDELIVLLVTLESQPTLAADKAWARF